MQSKLPDVNAAIVRHRNAALIAYDQKDFSKAAIAFNSIISLLPEDYRVEINSEKYYNLVKSKHIIECRYCETTYDEEGNDGKKTQVKRSTYFERSQISTYSLLLSSIDRLITKQSHMDVWDCPSCGETQPLLGSKIQTIKYEKPYYLKVIPEPPVRHGLHDRINFEQKFKVWYDIVFGELEYQIGLYRAEYAAQNPDVDMSAYDRFQDQ